MKQIDLDDLPPRVAQSLAGLGPGEELVVVRGGFVVTRLVALAAAPPPDDTAADQPAEERMKEVMEQFNAMIHDEF